MMPNETEKLGIYLEVRRNVIVSLRKVDEDPQLFAYDVLLQWKENVTVDDAKACEKLATALEKAEMQARAVKVREHVMKYSK